MSQALGVRGQCRRSRQSRSHQFLSHQSLSHQSRCRRPPTGSRPRWHHRCLRRLPGGLPQSRQSQSPPLQSRPPRPCRGPPSGVWMRRLPRTTRPSRRWHPSRQCSSRQRFRNQFSHNQWYRNHWHRNRWPRRWPNRPPSTSGRGRSPRPRRSRRLPPSRPRLTSRR